MNRSYLTKVSASPYDAGTGAESEQSRNAFLNEFASLPLSLQDFLTSDETSEAVADLSEHYDLDVAQTELTAWAIRNIVVGDTYIKELSEAIARMTDLNLEKSKEISDYIIKNILWPYWEDIKKIQIEKFVPPRHVEGGQGSSSSSLASPQTGAGQTAPLPPPPRQSFHEQNMASRSETDRGSSVPRPNQNLGGIGTTHYPGEDLPETGGNIIDLRSK